MPGAQRSPDPDSAPVTVVYALRINAQVPRSVDRLEYSFESLDYPKTIGLVEEAILVDSCSDMGYAEEIRSLCEANDIVYRRSEVYFPWNQGRILNGGMKLAMTEYVMRLDCDIIVPPSFWRNLEERLATDSFFISTTKDLKSLPEGRSYFQWLWPERTVWLKAHCRGMLGPTMGGLQVFSRDWFLKMRGYDEDISGWAPDDKDMVARAKRAGLKIVKFGANYHIHHPRTVKRLDPGKQHLKKMEHYHKHVSPTLPVQRNTGRKWGVI